MIRINLLGEDAVSDNSHQGFIAGYVGSLVALVLLCLYLNMSMTGELQDMTQQRDQLDRDLKSLKEATAEVDGLEKRRVELKDKLTVIALLRKSKRGPARVLDEINTATPDRVWITELVEKSGDMKISGKALDPIAITDFSTKLRASEFLPSVRLEKFDSANWKDAELREFSLKLRVNYAGRILPKQASEGAPADPAEAAASAPTSAAASVPEASSVSSSPTEAASAAAT